MVSRLYSKNLFGSNALDGKRANDMVKILGGDFCFMGNKFQCLRLNDWRMMVILLLQDDLSPGQDILDM